MDNSYFNSISKPLPGPLLESVVGRGLQQNLWQLHTHNIRDFSTERHYKVDDTPCGGGSGMVLKPNVLANAIRNTCNFNWPIIYLSPRANYSIKTLHAI